MPDETTGNDPDITLTARIVAAYVVKHTVPAAQLPDLIHQTWAALGSLGRTAPAPVVPEKPVPAVPIRKSIQPDYLLSLEDGKPYKSLKRHLMNKYGMTPDAYREKWGLPMDYPMVAPDYAAKRSELAKNLGLGTTRNRKKAAPE
ncbi:MucR family transcriptional regulator [Rhizobium sp. PP-F2F-G38]|nr:MucR family transcriptional regulator [Rhizobium sp. PP-WC-1G-195]PYE91752.1 MucR family transcriptional regulator [Rhizobium sp. PP-F2F-G38]TCL89636.1 MucR family transcriptional regulator [Rhizobium sp. PP-WC-2G-219]TCP77263.1 MucR family transcriptional regulator [Rhizobium sp. PP-CC-2G-626]TCQ03350.1 MucR family transcriptional regulator [Rhizobium sp. PP-F2F-G36]